MKKMLLALVPLALVTACSGGSPQDAASSESHDDHGAGTIKLTHYAADTELFVEVRPLAAGSRRRFDAHLSWLADYRAVTEGTLVVELIWPDGTIDSGKAEVSDTPGIFRVSVRASKAGKPKLRFRLQAKGRESVHEIGEVTVHPTPEAAAASLPKEAEDADAIPFSKEVQWKIPFRAEAVTRGAMAETIPVPVDVRLSPDAEAVVAAPVAGIVRVTGRVPAAGMQVQRGQQLGSIAAQLGGGEDLAGIDLAIRQARIRLEAARREVTRMDTLVRAESVPQRRLDEARTAERLAAAELAAAQQRRGALGGGGAGVPLVAPISGRILSASIVRGASVQSGAELVKIGNPASLWLVARVPEAQAARLGTPTGIDVQIDGNWVDAREAGTIALVQGTGFVDPATRTAEVVFALNGTRLRPGQRLQGRLQTGRTRDAISVPASAIVNEGGQDVIYVQTAGETFARRPVETGLRSAGRVEVRGAIRPGERVVTQGAAAVRAAATSPNQFGHGHAH
jgi:RND family efflux transporter MFP subunit